MTGRRALFLLLGLWTASALAQTAPIVTATASIPLDGGISGARAYVVTGGSLDGGPGFAMANAGEAVQVFNLADNSEVLPALQGQFPTFAVADFFTVGSGTVTLVAVADVGIACSVTFCLDVFFWDPVNGFVIKGVQATMQTSLSPPTAMAIDATGGTIRIFFTLQSPALVGEQDITINSMGTLTFIGTSPITFLNLVGGTVMEALTVDTGNLLLYGSDNVSKLYSFPEDGGTMGPNGPYSTPTTGDYSSAIGLYFYPPPFVTHQGTSYLLAGTGTAQGVYALAPGITANNVIGSVQVLSADGGRLTNPTGVSVNSSADLTLLTEDGLSDGGPPWLHVVSNLNMFPDGGAPDGGSISDGGSDGGTDAGVDAGFDSGVPVIPSVSPGPGAAVMNTNSCNCSSAGSAPVLLVLLLPLLAPRRRR
jgi:hypothetical protein